MQADKKKIGILVVGCGNMGSSHARAYFSLKDGFEIVGLVDKGVENRSKLSAELGGVPEFDSYGKALTDTVPDAVCICTYPDTHAEFAIKAFEHGAHVFVEKPVAKTVKEAGKVLEKAKSSNRKLVIGYILRHHPSWIKFAEIAKGLGKPLVMRMNLNQQSSGASWLSHKNLMKSLSPIVDCGVHYVDMMCFMTGASPVSVHAIGARLSNEISEDMYNYGQLQVTFDDGSVGWYEAGWGPMMSETAYFIKDVVGPKGCVSIESGNGTGASDDIDSHTKTNRLKVHSSSLGADGKFLKKDETIDMKDEPAHQDLCNREQSFFLKAITDDLDLSGHWRDALNSLKIVLAADKSFKTGRTVRRELK
jgi:predicted dehydrogenase